MIVTRLTVNKKFACLPAGREVVMSWGLFGQIILLIIIFAIIKTAVKCMHDNFCMKCKKL